MLRNYLKSAYRNLVRYKGYTFINILGLSIGLSCCILILLFVRDELSYDRFNKKSDHIYRIVSMFSENGIPRYHSGTPAPLASVVLDNCPGVQKVVRIATRQEEVITYENIQTRGNRFVLADPDIFKIFTIPFTKGNPNSALININSVVISETLAKKYFGGKDPMGKVLRTGRDNYYQDFKITGVFRDMPSNSSLKFDCLASFGNLYVKGNEGNLRWGSSNYETFVLLSKNSDPVLIENKITKIVEEYNSASGDSKTKYFLQPLTGIHLSLNPGNNLPTEKDNDQIFILIGLALLILLIACINFMNLATARSSMRESEVGIRKVVGANRLQLINQFLGESVLLSLLAFIISLPIVETLLPVFNQFADKQLSLLSHDNFLFLLSLFFMSLIVGVLAGTYPALFISSFKPVSILGGRLFSGATQTKAGLRRMLVVIQFVISIIFIVCTLVMHNQQNYIRDKNLGYNKDHLVVVPIHKKDVKKKYELYETEILHNASILGATATAYLPSEQGYYQNITFEGSAEGSTYYINWIPVDHDFIKTMGLKLIIGNNFSQDHLPGTNTTYILNETAVKQIGLKNPLGQQMDIIGWGPVIGVIKDFNFESLHNQIQPMALCVYPDAFQYLLVRIKLENISGSIHFLESQWKEIFPNQTFDYNFFDESFNRLYKTEIRQGNIFNLITALALTIACLGLFGLIHFSTGRRTKEIGIRKVFGSTVLNIVLLLIKDFIKWILIANIIAWPVAYYLMNKWLQDFAYRIDITWWVFVLSGGIALLIAILTVAFQAVKAATVNPIKSLRYE